MLPRLVPLELASKFRGLCHYDVSVHSVGSFAEHSAVVLTDQVYFCSVKRQVSIGGFMVTNCSWSLSYFPTNKPLYQSKRNVFKKTEERKYP